MIANNVPRRLPPTQLADITTIRQAWVDTCTNDMNAKLEKAQNDVLVEEIFLPLRDGTKSRTLVFKPKTAPVDGSPLVVLIHGGGFLFGAAEMEASACIDLTRSYGCVCLSLNYRLAPECKFPIAYNDCWDSLQWVRVLDHRKGSLLTDGGPDSYKCFRVASKPRERVYTGWYLFRRTNDYCTISHCTR